jgi:hypothetical protein
MDVLADGRTEVQTAGGGDGGEGVVLRLVEVDFDHDVSLHESLLDGVALLDGRHRLPQAESIFGDHLAHAAGMAGFGWIIFIPAVLAAWVGHRATPPAVSRLVIL